MRKQIVLDWRQQHELFRGDAYYTVFRRIQGSVRVTGYKPRWLILIHIENGG